MKYYSGSHAAQQTAAAPYGSLGLAWHEAMPCSAIRRLLHSKFWQPELYLTALQCAMARMPNNPALLIMFTNYLIEVRKDGQGARTQLQLAQKAAPSLLDQFNICRAQQLAKLLKKGTACTLLWLHVVTYTTCKAFNI